MSTISLELLRSGEKATNGDVFEACRTLGFFLLDLHGDEAGKELMRDIDHLFGLCKDLMNLPDDIKEKYQHDIPKSFLG